jgi:hypothetical protein
VVFHHMHPLYPGAHRHGTGQQNIDPLHAPHSTPANYAGPPVGHHQALWHPHQGGPE